MPPTSPSNRTPRPESPPLGKSFIKSYRQPRAVDLTEDDTVVFHEDCDSPNYRKRRKGSLHPDKDKYPGYKLKIAEYNGDGTRVSYTYVKYTPRISRTKNDKGQIVTKTTSLVEEGSDPIELTSTTQIAEDVNLADGDIERTVGTVPRLFPETDITVNCGDPIPSEFKALMPSIHGRQVLDGQVTEIPQQGIYDITRRDQILTEQTYQWESEFFNPPLSPITLIDRTIDGIQAGGSTFGGKFDVRKTISLEQQEVEEGFFIKDSSVRQIHGGRLTLRTTEELTGTQDPYIEVIDEGDGYDTPPDVHLEGDAEGLGGAEATAVLGAASDRQTETLMGSQDLFDFVAKLFNEGTWRNPSGHGVNIFSGNLQAGSDPIEDALNQAPSNIVVGPSSNPFVLVDLTGERKFVLKKLVFTQRQGGPGRPSGDDHRIRVAGSIDGINFTDLVISQMTSNGFPQVSNGFKPSHDPEGTTSIQEAPEGTLQDGNWLTNNRTAYRYFKLMNDDTHNDAFLTLGEIKFYGVLDYIDPENGGTEGGNIPPPAFPCPYVHDGDGNDVFFRIGTFVTGDPAVWTNPQGRVEGVDGAVNDGVQLSSTPLLTGSLDLLLNHQYASVCTISANKPWYMVDLGEGRAMQSSHVSIREWSQSNGLGTENISFQGSNDGVNFVEIRRFNKNKTRNHWTTNAVPSSAAYRYFRMQLTADDEQRFTLGEWAIYGTLFVPQSPTTGGETQVLTAINVTPGHAGNYLSEPRVVIDRAGTSGGVGASARAILDGLGAIARVDIITHGWGFLTTPTIEFDGGLGGQGVAEAHLGFGVDEVEVTNGGQYDTTPNVEFDGDGSGAQAVAVMGRGLTRIDVIDGGRDYSEDTEVSITGGGGSGATAEVERIFETEGTVVDDGGSGYTSEPTVTPSSGNAVFRARIGRALLTIGVLYSNQLFATAPDVNLTPDNGAVATAHLGFQIDSIEITDFGVGYYAPPDVRIDGDGAGATARAELRGFGLDSVLLMVVGSGYTSDPPVRVQGGGGAGAVAVARRNLGVFQIDVDDGGSGYITPPDVIIDGDGSGATAHAVLTGDVVTSIVVDTNGSGYTGHPVPDVLIGTVDSGGGSGATATAVLDAAGPLKEIIVQQAGGGYTTDPTVVIDPNNISGGTGASALAVLTESQVIEIIVENPGLDYTSATVHIGENISGGGTGAAATAHLKTTGRVKSISIDTPATDGFVDPPIVELTGGGGTANAIATLDSASTGAVARIDIVLPDEYVEAPTLNISGGGGSDAAAHVTLKNTGRITAINIINSGEGFNSTPDVDITDEGGGTGAEARATLSAGGSVISVQMVASGRDYTEPPTVKFTGGGGAGGAEAIATLKHCGGVKSISLIEPGDYQVAPRVIIDPPSGPCVGETHPERIVLTDPLVIARAYHTATKLADGRILITGGERQMSPLILKSCAIYDPITEVWSSAADMNAFRKEHTATLLTDGKVLVSSATTSEIYDPEANTWTSVGTFSGSRTGHTATLLDDGKVLITGGTGGPGVANSARVYDPDSQTWSNTAGDMSNSHVGHSAIKLPNGKVAIIGGVGIEGNAFVELYDPDTSTFSSLANMNVGRGLFATDLLDENRIIVAGGQGDSSVDLKSVEIYDIQNNTWTLKADMPEVKVQDQGVTLPDGRFIVFGGFIHEGNDAINAVSIYNAESDSWNDSLTLNESRYNGSVTLLNDGRVLLAGGYDSDGNEISSCELYEPPATGNGGRTATAIYHLAREWPTLTEYETDAREGIVTKIRKRIVPAGSEIEIPGSYTDIKALDKYRSIQIISAIDLRTLPGIQTFFSSQNIRLPEILLGVTPTWSSSTTTDHNINDHYPQTVIGSNSASASIFGSIVVLKKLAFWGAAIARTERQFFFGMPPRDLIPEATVIRPSSGTATLIGRSVSQSASGIGGNSAPIDPNSPYEWLDPTGHMVHGTYAGYLQSLGLPPGQNPTSYHTEQSEKVQVVDISDVITPGVRIDGNSQVNSDAGSGTQLPVNVVASGNFFVNIPASTPGRLNPDDEILAEVALEKWRFGLYVLSKTYVILPNG